MFPYLNDCLVYNLNIFYPIPKLERVMKSYESSEI
jgi:hypothetical protein